MAGGMGRKDAEHRETLAERTSNTRARQQGPEPDARPPQVAASGARGGHSTAGFHGKRPASWAMPPQEPLVPSTPPPRLRHCWYDGAFGRQPALLLKWRNIADSGHWEGFVVFAAPDEAGTGWAIVEQWVDARLLSRA